MSDTGNDNNLTSHPDRPPTDAGLATTPTTDVAKEPSGVLLPSNVVDSGGPVHPSDSVPWSDSVHPSDSNDPVSPSGHHASTGAADQSALHVPLLPMATDELAERLRPVVLATAGVANLVPTMATALTRLGLHRGGGVKRSLQAGTPATSSHAKHREAAGDPAAPADGITVSVESDAVTVVLDITVLSAHSVLTTALAVRSAAAGFLTVAHPGRYTVKVNVLGLDPGPDNATTQQTSEPPSIDTRLTTKTLRPGPSANR